MKETLTHTRKGVHLFYLLDEEGGQLALTKKISTRKKTIHHFPFSFRRTTGEVIPKRIREIEFQGWRNDEELPNDFKRISPYGFRSVRARSFFSLLQKEFKAVSKIVVKKNGKTSFQRNAISFKWDDLVKILRSIERNKSVGDETRRAIIRNGIASLNSKYKRRSRELTSSEFQQFISNYTSFEKLKESDLQTLAEMMGSINTTAIQATEYILRTKDKIDVKYLDDIIARSELLIQTRPNSEEDWQNFFEEHTWTLNHLFPFQVILHKGKAYVGGKTLENSEGRIVDFLFNNGFNDNFALLEIKTPGASLLRTKPYRAPDVFALSDDLSGGINQCLDQKSNFLAEFGKSRNPIDPRTVLVIGDKSKLTNNQAKCFEMLRSNQKHVEIVTFDELIAKLQVLRKVITGQLKKI